MLKWTDLQSAIDSTGAPSAVGHVVGALGMVAEVRMPGLKIGSQVEVTSPGGLPVVAEVVGVGEGTGTVMPVGAVRGIEVGSVVRELCREITIGVGPGFLGRVVDAFGNPLDDGPPIEFARRVPLFKPPINPLNRPPIREPMSVGIRSIDAALTCGRGQRVAIMAGSGVGKSVMLGMIAKRSDADVNVIALIGERGREVREFLEENLGEEGLARSVVVVSTSDTPALQRIRAAHTANALAEGFRMDGADVLLLVDSMTRIAMAQREVGLAAGEPPTTRGYTPSCYGLIPLVLERAGCVEGQGSITGLYTVLTEGDDLQDPIADAVRATVDGHVVLSRALTDRGHYPPVDVLRSTSRVMIQVVHPEHRRLSLRLRSLLSAYEEAEDLINLGAYVQGSNPEIDEAIERMDAIRAFLKQDVDEPAPWDETPPALAALLGETWDVAEAAA